MAKKPPKQADQPPTFETESKLFLKTAGGGQSKRTAATYRTGLSYLQSYLAETFDWTDETPIAELTPDHFQEFPTWLLSQTYQRSKRAAPTPLAESTRGLYLLAATRFLRFLVLRKQLPTFDYAEYDRIKEELSKATNAKAKPIAQKIPQAEVVIALIKAAETPPKIDEDMTPGHRRRLILVWRRNLAIVHALRSSGMRVGELTSLTRGDLDHSRHGAWVSGKGRKTRFVAFDNVAWQAINDYLEERLDETLMVEMAPHPLFCRHDRAVRTDSRQPLSVRTVQRLMKDLAREANVIQKFNISPHSMRHFFANGLLEFTGNLALVQEALGHQDPKTTRGYTKIKVDEIAANVQAMARQPDEADDEAVDNLT